MCRICTMPKGNSRKYGCGGIVPIAIGKLDARFEICAMLVGECNLVLWLRSLDAGGAIGMQVGLPYSKQTFKKYKINREVCDIVLGHLLGLNRYFKVKELYCKMTVFNKKTYIELTPTESCAFMISN